MVRRSNDPTLDNYDIDANGRYVYYGNTNWLKLFYKPRNYTQQHNVNVQGGNENSSFYISGRYYGQDGIYKVGTENFDQYNLRAKASVKLYKWLRLDYNVSLLNRDYLQPMLHYDNQLVGRQVEHRGHPVSTVRNPDGTWTYNAVMTGYATFSDGTSWQENKKLDNIHTVALSSDIVKDVFNITGDFTYKAIRSTRDRAEALMEYSDGIGLYGTHNNTSSLENYRYDTDYMSANIVGTLTPKLSGRHSLNIVAGWNIEDNTYKTQQTKKYGLLDATMPNFTLMDDELYAVTAGGYSWGLVGFFARGNYVFNEKYIAEVSARYDGSSKFPPNSQWGFFPSVSLGWILSGEEFMTWSRNWLDMFKIRVNGGSLGNSAIDPYQFLEQLSVSRSSVLFNGSRLAYTYVPNLIPSSLTWEKIETYDVGVDISVLRGKLSFTGDYYHRYNKDLYTVGPDKPHVLGADSPYGNYGKTLTKGWELSLNWRDRFMAGGKPFTYNAKFMVWDNRTWVKEYYNENNSLTNFYKGMEVGEIWGYRTAGIFASNEEARNWADQSWFKNGSNLEAYAGDLKFIDVNGDGKIDMGNRTLDDHGDLEIIGNTNPRYQFGVNLSANWNGIGVSMFWQGVGKRHWYPRTETGFFWGVWNRPYGYLMKSQTGSNVAQIDYSDDNNWVVTNMEDNPYWVRPVAYAANRNLGPLTWENDHYLQNAAYVRLKNLTVEYSFPQKWISKMHMDGLRVFFTGENLLTFSPMFKYTKMFDPEVIAAGDTDFRSTPGLSGSGTAQGNGDGYSYPMLKSYSIGVSVTF